MNAEKEQKLEECSYVATLPNGERLEGTAQLDREAGRVVLPANVDAAIRANQGNSRIRVSAQIDGQLVELVEPSKFLPASKSGGWWLSDSETRNRNLARERKLSWVRVALEHVAAGRVDEADQCAYEAGLYGGDLPQEFVGHGSLITQFETGVADAAADRETQSRTSSIPVDFVEAADVLAAKGRTTTINPARDVPFMTASGGHVLIHSADGRSVLPPEWTGVCVDAADVKKFWHIGRSDNERSFTALSATTYDEAVREAESRGLILAPQWFVDMQPALWKKVVGAAGLNWTDSMLKHWEEFSEEEQEALNRAADKVVIFQYELRVAGRQFMTGDKGAIGVLFGNLTGRNFDRKQDPGEDHQDWLRYMSREYSTSLPMGAVVEMLSPTGDLMEQNSIGGLLGVTPAPKADLDAKGTGVTNAGKLQVVELPDGYNGSTCKFFADPVEVDGHMVKLQCAEPGLGYLINWVRAEEVAAALEKQTAGAKSPFAIGQRFTFKPGDKIIGNGFPGTVVRMYSEGMVEARLPGGVACIPASFPDCYPDTTAAPSNASQKIAGENYSVHRDKASGMAVLSCPAWKDVMAFGGLPAIQNFAKEQPGVPKRIIDELIAHDGGYTACARKGFVWRVTNEVNGHWVCGVTEDKAWNAAARYSEWRHQIAMTPKQESFPVIADLGDSADEIAANVEDFLRKNGVEPIRSWNEIANEIDDAEPALADWLRKAGEHWDEAIERADRCRP